MLDLVTGFSASSSYASLTQASRYSSPFSGASATSSQSVQSGSFSFDAFVAEDHSAPAVSLPFGEGDKSSDDMMEMLEEKLTGFLSPFGESADDLAEIVTNALSSLSDLVEDTSVDAASLSIDIRFSRVEESYSSSAGGYAQAGVFSGFALEVSVSTATVDYDPGRAAVINMAGSKLEFTHTQMIEGHKLGVFRRESPGIDNFPGFNKEKAEETNRVVEFLKDMRKQIKEFNDDEEKSYRHQMRDALKSLHHMRVFA